MKKEFIRLSFLKDPIICCLQETYFIKYTITGCKSKDGKVFTRHMPIFKKTGATRVV